MKCSGTLGVALCTLFAAVSSLPTPEGLPEGFEPVTRAEIMRRRETSAKNPLEKRTPGGIYLCTGNSYTGTCGYKVQPFDQCIVLTSP
ncbi:hypothetical protein MMC11_001468 [Xylographa trunciseda]|nr:hypothetical protein [Xylographa trunciseda]